MKRNSQVYEKYDPKIPDHCGYQKLDEFIKDDRVEMRPKRVLAELLTKHFSSKEHDLIVYKKQKDFVVCDRIAKTVYVTVLEFDAKCKHLMLYGYNPASKTKHQRGHEAIGRMNGAREYAAQKGVAYRTEPPYGMNAGIADIKCKGSFDADILGVFMNIAFRTSEF